MDTTLFTKVATYLTQPLVLIGFTLFLLFCIFQLIINAGLIPQLTKQEGSNILRTILRYGFISSITVVILGFGLQFYNNNKVIADNDLKKANSAIESVSIEIGNNVISLTTLSEAIETSPPEQYAKTTPRRVNESELAHKDRIKNNYRDYQLYVEQFFDTFQISNEVFRSHRNILVSLDNNGLPILEKVYEAINKSRGSLESYKSDIIHSISTDYSDIETRAYLLSQIRIRTSESKAFLCKAYSALCQLAEYYPIILNSEIPNNFSGINLAPGNQQAGLFYKKFAYYYKIKSDELGKLSSKLNVAKRREVNRRITDPYILFLRKMNGMKGELSQNEIWALERKELSQEKDDPAKLLSLATSSYIEGDGDYAKIYLERIKFCRGIDNKRTKYIDASLYRLNNPDIYEESLGIMVIEVERGGLFHQSGIIEGDIIYGLNGKAIQEPDEIARALGWSSDSSFLLSIHRGDKMITKAITPNKSAGALLWVLVTFYQYRL